MNATPPPKPSLDGQPDARRGKRERTFLPARISFGEGALKADCVVTQFSPSGARINVPAAVALPDRFNIAIPQRGLNCRAKLVWRKDDLAGLEFEQTESAPLAPIAKTISSGSGSSKPRTQNCAVRWRNSSRKFSA